jgi:putative ABC transport system permease protein
MEFLLQDLRYGFRALLKSPGFTAVALMALALGIGASSAVFSVVNAVLLRSLPYKDPAALVVVSEKTVKQELPVSYLNYVDWREQNKVFEQVAAYRNDNLNLSGTSEPERLESLSVSNNFLSALGLHTLAGRDFLPEEDRAGASPVVILNHGFWQRRFGADPGVVGRQITLSQQSYTVVGVLPADFEFGPTRADILTPLGLSAGRFQTRGKDPGVSVIARLKPGVSFGQARAEMETIMSRLGQQYPDVLAGHQLGMQTLYENTVGDIKPTLLMLFGAVGFVLLIACANVANLLLARSAAREKEVAIRRALGAGRNRLIRQFLTESVLLSVVGGLLGLLLAYCGIRLLVAFSPEGLPRVNEIGIDAWVFVFTLAVSVVTGIIFGLAPALRATNPNLTESLKEGDRGSTGSRQRVRGALVVTEVALALVLLIGAALMIRSFWRLQDVNPGFDAKNLLTMQMSVTAAPGEGQSVAAFFDQAQEKIKGLPGVRSVAVSNGLPFGGANQMPLTVEGRPQPAQGQTQLALMYVASPDYLRTMGIRLVKGRSFSERDTKTQPPVILIDEVLARQYFSGEDPLGQRLRLAVPGTEKLPGLEIVGVVENVKDKALGGTAPPSPQFYYNFNQVPEPLLPSMIKRINLVVRTTSEPTSIAPAVRAQVSALRQDQPVYNVKTMEQIVSESVAAQRFSMLLLSIFALVALVLAAIGIYGLMAYSVSQRTHELGIRRALGARASDILGLVVGQGMILAVVGIVIGLAAAFALTRVLSSLLFQVSATDPYSFIVIPLLLGVVALLANFLPARRATKVDPMIALRAE